MNKPLDVELPTNISIDTGIATILIRAGTCARQPFCDTPLDFIESRTYMSSKWSKTVFRWIQQMGLQTRPLQRIPNDRDPQPSNLRQHIVLGVATATFASIHLLGWNFSFPNHAELLVWRMNCMAQWSLLAVYGAVEVAACWREGYANLGLDTMNGYKLRWPACLLFFVPAGLYLCARVCLIVEVILSMRSLLSGAFINVSWSAFLPHL